LLPGALDRCAVRAQRALIRAADGADDERDALTLQHDRADIRTRSPVALVDTRERSAPRAVVALLQLDDDAKRLAASLEGALPDAGQVLTICRAAEQKSHRREPESSRSHT
jgi:hypothetical protein